MMRYVNPAPALPHPAATAFAVPTIFAYSYDVGANTAPSVYNVQIIEVCENGTYCAMGISPGYFEVNAIDSRPAWLMILTGMFSSLGPLLLGAYMVWDMNV